MKISIIGLGWFGNSLAEKLKAKHTVCGTKSSREGIEDRNSDAVPAYYLDLNQRLDCAKLAPIFDVDCVLVNIPPSAAKTVGYIDMMKKLLGGIARYRANHLIFISSTGVFGDHQHIVDEDTIPEPTRGNGEVLFRAEKYLAAHFAGRLTIIRPGGLVGGDRHPVKFLAGRKNVSQKDAPVNLVHRDDLIALTQFIIEHETELSCFHAVAAEHPSKKEYYTAVAAKIGWDEPQFDESDTKKGKLILGDKTQSKTIEFAYNNPFDFPWANDGLLQKLTGQ